MTSKANFDFIGNRLPNFDTSSRWIDLMDKYSSLMDDTDNNKSKIDLPYLDLSKLTSYVENGYLVIKYDNPDDTRRKTYHHTQYVGDANIKIKYENGFLLIEREEKKPERRFIKVN